ncbi:hypothetical protein M409DRAFT_50788 [Zasmidium cellare ATCC 36951]|uniref:NAD(P)-binding protein n=1 Tax=Zasmidium cellare ATCC 36951 TaxID=1080233 RepID=A0A6A6CW43_ZASCE|nr:uncharacterized protein M409DRAFT_50788 [Zasmidium cellare ATCC 36951]KAF2171331.1 hypothetical protein M409DRAFT_50788 [Zasmidium cellare ATCC 36951]
MPTAVLTGCNSGIGYEMAKIAVKDGYKVFALDVVFGDKLESLQQEGCNIGQLDVTSPESIAKTKEWIGNQPVDLLFNIAGIMPDPKKEDSLDTVNLSTIQKSFAINAYGPFLLTQTLLPNVLTAGSNPKRIAVISSRVGSIADNTSGGAYAYRASKTAVNSFFKTLAVELKGQGVAVTILHPGFTNTNLSPDLKNIPGVVEPEVAAKGLWKIVKEKGLEDTGKFWHREGTELPW